jgi:hypothetical protein
MTAIRRAAPGQAGVTYTPITLTAVSGVITPNASLGYGPHRHDATGNVTLADPTGGWDGEPLEVQVYAFGGDRTLTVAGSPITILSGTYWWGHFSHDAARTTWILDDDGSGRTGYTDEQVRDVIGSALVAGSNVTITPNDGADTITISAATSGSSGIPASTVDAKGDLIAGTANDTVARFGVGTDGQALVASSGASTGLAWAAPAPATHTHAAGDVTSGTVATARLGSGTASSTTFLRGDQTWAVPAGGSGTTYPTLSGETGVVDNSYPVGHGHRYGIGTDPNAALAAMANVLTSTNAALTRVDPSGTDRIPLYSLYVPAGRYVVTTPGAFLSGTSSDGRRIRGVIIQGAGRGAVTDIVFDPAAAGGYLFDNQDRMSRMTFKDITFTGNSTNANFMNGVSNGGPQSHIFDRVQWRGTWTKGFYLSGTDTDSELTWNDCTVYGFWTFFLENDNPQGLNYDFIELRRGAGVRLDGRP